MTRDLGVVVNQRDCYGWPEPLIQALLQAVPVGTPVLFMDGGSPQPVRDALRRSAERWGFQLERHEAFISANQARLLALERLSVSHLLCVENDVRLLPGCGQFLLAAAERHQADVVVPLVLEENDGGRQRIHVAGGRCRLRRGWTGTGLEVKHHQRHQPCEPGPQELWTGGQPTELVEYHALLLRTAFGRIHPLHDPAIASLPETLDFSLAVQRWGGRCWLEPAALAVFLTPSRVSETDRPLFLHRWADHQQRRDIAHFRRKWGLGPWSWVLASQLSWVAAHRSLARRRAAHRTLSLEVYGVLNRRLLAPLQDWLSPQA
jgi:GT2 family glycosyltransferase